jgi:hypothetical protein
MENDEAASRPFSIFPNSSEIEEKTDAGIDGPDYIQLWSMPVKKRAWQKRYLVPLRHWKCG